MLIKVTNVVKQFGEETILKGISLEIHERQSLSITGPSGSGKSTLLSIVGLLLEPTEGEIIYKNKNVSEFSDDSKSKLRNSSFGFIFQNPKLIGSLTVLGNVLLPARLSRKKGLEEKAIKQLRELGLEHRLNYYPHQLSIGQKRRAAVARALLLDPIAVFADEPTNDLDVERANWMGDYLFSLPSRGCSLVLVTHDMKLAAKADKVLQIHNGNTTELNLKN